MGYIHFWVIPRILGELNLNYMKKILEIIQDGDMKVRFNTDITFPMSNNDAIEMISSLMMSFSSSVFGKHEQNVTTAIRIVALSEMALSGSIDKDVNLFRRQAKDMNKVFLQTMEMMKRRNKGEIISVPGFVNLTKTNS